MLQFLPIYLSHRKFTPPPAYNREGAGQCTHNRCADRAKQCALRAELRTDRAGLCGDKAETGSSLPPSRYFESTTTMTARGTKAACRIVV